MESGLRSLFVGFETLNPDNLRQQGKFHNLNRDYGAAIARLHERGVQINGSFVFGMDADDATAFDRATDWAIAQGIETATFHVLTPYPGTALHARLQAAGRILHRDWDRYDTRHAVFQPARLSPEALEAGYWRAYRQFYRWPAIARSALTKPTWPARARHLAYTAAWKKFEPAWDWLIRTESLPQIRPALTAVLDHFHGDPRPNPAGDRRHRSPHSSAFRASVPGSAPESAPKPAPKPAPELAPELAPASAPLPQPRRREIAALPQENRGPR